MDKLVNGTDPFKLALGRLNGLFTQLADEEKRDRGALAALRKGLREPDGWNPATAMIIDRALGDVRLPPSQEDVLYTTAMLFALHPNIAVREDGWSKSLLASLNQWMGATKRTSDDDRKAMDRRVLALLNADESDLVHHLRHLIGMFRGSEIGIDWYQLARDLKAWNVTERPVQRRWARDWWRAPGWTEDSAPVTDLVTSGNE